MEIKPIKQNVILYRVSTDMQDFEAQKTGIERYVKENNIIVHKIIEEKGISGYKTKLEDREGLQELIKMALNNELNSIIVFNQDRIGRRVELLSFMSIMNEQNVTIHSVTEGIINGDNETSELIQAIKFWTASYESKKTSLRVKEGRRATIEKYNYSGGVPNFGYKVVNKSLVPDEEESRVVQLIFDKYLKEGYQNTVTYLNDNNILKRGEKWTKTKVFSVLKNTIYIGKKRYQEDLLDFPELKIIDEELFNKVQERATARNTRGTTRYTNRTQVLFEGLLYHQCTDEIQHKLNVDYVKAKNGDRVHTYRCKYCKDNKAKITKNFNSTKIEPIIIENIKTVMDNLSVKELESRYRAEIENSTKDLRHNISVTNKNIVAKKKAIDNATKELERIFMGESTSSIDVINNIIQKLNKEVLDLQERLAEYTDQLNKVTGATSNALYLLDKYKDFSYVFDMADNVEKKAMLQEIINKIVITKDSIDIQLNLY